MADLTGPDVIHAITNGDLDDMFAEIGEAIRSRILAGEVTVRWGIRYDDLEITEENLTVGEALSVERDTNISWSRFSPAQSVIMCAAIIRAVLVSRRNMKPSQAVEAVNARPADELKKMVFEYTDTEPPKDGGGSETSP